MGHGKIRRASDFECRIQQCCLDVEGSTGVEGEVTRKESSMNWEIDLGVALARAAAEEKPVFVDFFNPD